MRQATIYTRFSPRPSAGAGMSWEFQEEKAREYCDYWSFDVLDVHRDKGASGRRACNRPGIASALVHVCKVRGVLVLYNLARLSHSLKDLVDVSHLLDKKQADLALVTDHVDTTKPNGRYFFCMMSMLGRWRRETTGEHVRTVMLNMQKDGYKIGSQPPYGYMIAPYDDRRIAPNSAEAENIRLIVNLDKRGMSAKEICDELTRRGRKPRGKAWYSMTVTRILDKHSD